MMQSWKSKAHTFSQKSYNKYGMKENQQSNHRLQIVQIKSTTL